MIKFDKTKAIVFVTAYTSWQSRLAADVGVDGILVGDSVGMVEYGNENTRDVSLAMIMDHASAVMRGLSDYPKRPLVVVDMPYRTCDVPEEAIYNCKKVVNRTGCDAVKIEGAPHIVESVVDSGINVMGHSGLKPQSADKYMYLGKKEEEATEIINECNAIVAAGAFSMVLECVPIDLANNIVKLSSVPVIGIGAGSGCDGQILVFHDILGLYEKDNPSFAPKYIDGYAYLKEGLSKYVSDIRSG